LHEWPQAELFLSRCRERWSSDETRPLDPWVERRIREAKQQLADGDYGPVRISSDPAGATITVAAFGDDESFSAPRIVWLHAGEQRVAVRADGYQPRMLTVQVVRGERIDVGAALVAVAVERPQASDEPATEAAALPGHVERGSGSAPGRGSKAGWIVGGAGVGLVAIGGVFHVLAFDARSDANDLPPGPEFDALDDQFSTRRAVAIGAYAVGGATLAAGIYLLVRSRGDRDSAPALNVGRGPGDVGISLSWSSW